MAQPIAERAVQVRPVVQAVHLVDPHAFEAVGRGLDGIDQRHRFAVGERHDEVGVRTDVIEHRVGRRGSGNLGGHDEKLRWKSDVMEPRPLSVLLRVTRMRHTSRQLLVVSRPFAT